MKKRWLPTYKLHGSYLNSGIKKTMADGSWYTYHFYQGKLGSVVIFQDHNVMASNAARDYMRLDAVINGRIYAMSVNSVAFSEVSLKRMASNFLKECLKKEVSNADIPS